MTPAGASYAAAGNQELVRAREFVTPAGASDAAAGNYWMRPVLPSGKKRKNAFT